MMGTDIKHLRLKGILLSKNDLPLYDQKGNSTFQEYLPNQKCKTKKFKQIAYSSAQKKPPQRTTSPTIISLRWKIHTQRRPRTGGGFCEIGPLFL